MFNRFRPFRAAVLLAAPLFLSACGDDDVPPDPVAAAPTTMYVVNQGNFLRANAAVTRYDRRSGAVVRDQFAAANPGVSLGDVAQSMTIAGDRGYVVVNNSNRIVVVQLSDFKQVAEITGLEQPRYMAVYNGKGYVTEWGNTFGAPGRVSELDLSTNTRTGATFATGVQPEEIVATPTGVLVANAGGSAVTAISVVTSLVTNIATPDGPTALRLDNAGRVWVLCTGRIAYTPTFDVDTAASTPGALVSMPLAALATQTARTFTRKGVLPGGLALSPDRTTVYYTYVGNVFAVNTSSATLAGTPLIRRAFDALGVDPTDGTLYAADQRSFTADGRVLRYRPTGAVIDSFATAVGPTQFVF